MSNPGNLARAGSVVALGAMACLVGARAATPLYSISDLGTLGGAQSSANAINNLGQIVGRADLANNNAVLAHAFVYSNGIMTDLSVLGTYNTGQGTTSSSAAYGINNKGEIVGQSSTTNGVLHAFLFSQGQMSDLGVLPGSQQSKAHAINDSSQVVGWTLGPGTQRAFLYENGSLTDLGTLGGDGQLRLRHQQSGSGRGRLLAQQQLFVRHGIYLQQRHDDCARRPRQLSGYPGARH
ncbi:MAG TPA: hypothetical protein VG146_19525 [Verrucomicrobiae bacterium]|nr:hypothetical protein [Verrucomicrobiae bacterium]